MARLSRFRSLPWLALAQAAVVASDHWRALSDKERTRLTGLVRAARGRPGNLTVREREELRRLVGKLDLPGMGREMLPLARKGRRGRRR